MAYRTATFGGGASFQSRGAASGIGRRALRATLRHLALGVAATAAVAVTGTAVILAALWFIGSATVSNP
jgi:hypothetical protein